MKKSFIYTILVSFCALMMASCVSQKDVRRAARPDHVELQVQMNNLKYLGSETVTVEYNTYVGIFRRVKTVNGEAYQPRFHTVSMMSTEGIPAGSRLCLALSKVQEKYPDADYYLPVNYKKEISYMFLGRIVKESVTVKAYQFK